MELTYSCAIVSLCPDLTSRSEPSWPVGVLLVGELGDHGLASVLVPSLVGRPMDDITREVLMSVPDLLRLHVDEVLAEDVTLPTAEILRGLHEKLRNTLFVSEILDEKTAQLGEPFEAAVASLLLDEYKAAAERGGWTLEPVSVHESSPADRPAGAASVPGRHERIGVGRIPDASSMFRFGPPARPSHAQPA